MNDSQFSSQSRMMANKHKSRYSHKKAIIIVGVVLVIAVLATFIILRQIKINSGANEQEAAQGVQDQVAKIMIIPDENALVSDIENSDQVKSQPFFANVQDGDKVLVFAGAAKIVIYRPSTNQIVNAGPIVDDTASIDEETAQ